MSYLREFGGGEGGKKYSCGCYTAGDFIIIRKLQRTIDRMGWDEMVILGVYQS